MEDITSQKTCHKSVWLESSESLVWHQQVWYLNKQIRFEYAVYCMDWKVCTHFIYFSDICILLSP